MNWPVYLMSEREALVWWFCALLAFIAMQRWLFNIIGEWARRNHQWEWKKKCRRLPDDD